MGKSITDAEDLITRQGVIFYGKFHVMRYNLYKFTFGDLVSPWSLSMDKTKALQKLLKRKYIKKEIETLNEAPVN